MSPPEAETRSGQEPSTDLVTRRGHGDRIAIWLVGPLAVVLAAACLTFVVFLGVVRVDGPSMLPTFHSGDRLIVTKGYRTPARGDIVVFSEAKPTGGSELIIKRVVAVAGDTVEVRTGRALVDGAPEPVHTGIFVDQESVAAITVPKGSIYVLGDNRPVSFDSRDLGPIPLSQIQGRAVAVVWPPASFRSVR